MADLDDVSADVYEWLPAICDWFPGVGVTPFNVWSLEVNWWLIFKGRAQASVDAAKKQRESGRGK